MLRPLLIAAVLATSLTACDKSPGKGDSKKEASAQPAKLVIAPEDFITVQANAVASGPVVTGSIQPERKADLRAEVSAVVLQVLKENGDVVRRGDVLARLDQTAILDNLRSAEDNARNAAQSLDQAERNLQRLITLRASGMTSLQALDDAEVRRNGAKSELSASNARAVLARQQLERPIVRAPFYAYPVRPGITFTYLGVKVDARAAVHFGGRPSSNLFAAGEVMAGNVLGKGYLAGIGMTIGTAFGRIAGTEAAHAALG